MAMVLQSEQKYFMYLLRISVAMVITDVFAKILGKIGKILKLFNKLDEIKNRGVLCQS